MNFRIKHLSALLCACMIAVSCDTLLDLLQPDQENEDKKEQEKEQGQQGDEKVPATSVSITSDNPLVMVEGSTSSVTISVLPENTTDKEYSWTSSDSSIATAEKLTVSAIAPGEATLTLTVGSVSTTLAVTVNAKGPEICTDPMVDLGLSVMWASCNLGAESPDQYGKYYAWGETEQREEKYTVALYKWLVYNGGYFNAAKYNVDPDKGVIDGKLLLDPEDDAATVALGGDWRMPTYDETRELRMNCRWDLYTYNNVSGYKVTGPSGKSIFIPFAGCIDLNQSEPTYTGQDAFFWTKQWQPGGAHQPNHYFAYSFNTTAGTYGGILSYIIDPRYCGLSVRAVNGRAAHNPKVLSGFPCERVKVSAVSAQLRSFIHPLEGETPSSYGVCYAIGKTPTIDDGYAEGVLDGNVVLTDIKGLKPGAEYTVKYYVTINGETTYNDDVSFIELKESSTMLSTGNLIKSSSSEARVSASFDLSLASYDNAEMLICYGTSANPEIGGMYVSCEGAGAETGASVYKATLTGLSEGKEYHYRACLKIDGNVLYGEDKTFKAESYGISKVVDLGLSVKWAAWNLGAETPYESGDYYSWGDTAPKTIFGRSNNAYFDNTVKKYTKYTESKNDGTVVDNKRILDLVDDAARVQWGGTWRTPTPNEYRELFDETKTIFEPYTYNGISGYRVTSKVPGYEGNWIFFPNAGYYRGGYSTLIAEYVKSAPYMMTSGKSSGSNGTDLITAERFYTHAMDSKQGCYEPQLQCRYWGYTVRAVCD